MRILVIGGSGFIGPYVIQELHNLGHTIALFNRGNNPSSLSNITHIPGNINHLSQYKSDFEKFNPDVVIHMIAYTELDAQIAMSVFKGIAKRMVVLSSMDVYQAYGVILGIEDIPPLSTPLNEQSALRQTLYPYGGSYEKIKVEQIARSQSTDLPSTILRLPMVYGPGDPSHRLYKYVKRHLDSRPFLILDEQYASWRGTRGYVGNVAHAVTLATISNSAANRIYNVGDTFAYSEKEWLNAIANVMKWDVNVYSVTKSMLPKPLINEHLRTKHDWITDTTRIRNELGYKEIFTEVESLEATIHWEKRNPPTSLHPKEYPLFEYEAEDLFWAEHLQ